ncbi:hypothetical protein Q1695_007912 [Nippostrongylus brasiliensis]|nr:hypothetical protein Q1695_007912 [Nippostrongylus brasiliensis]
MDSRSGIVEEVAGFSAVKVERGTDPLSTGGRLDVVSAVLGTVAKIRDESFEKVFFYGGLHRKHRYRLSRRQQECHRGVLELSEQKLSSPDWNTRKRQQPMSSAPG